MWTDFYWALLAGCALDLLLGDPAWLYHPVCIIGKYISWCEKKLRARGGDLRRSAVLLTASTVLITTAAAGLLVFLYARKTHTHDNVLNRQEMVLIGMLLIASVPATWMLVG